MNTFSERYSYARQLGLGSPSSFIYAIRGWQLWLFYGACALVGWIVGRLS